MIEDAIVQEKINAVRDAKTDEEFKEKFSEFINFLVAAIDNGDLSEKQADEYAFFCGAAIASKQ